MISYTHFFLTHHIYFNYSIPLQLPPLLLLLLPQKEIESGLYTDYSDYDLWEVGTNQFGEPEARYLPDQQPLDHSYEPTAAQQKEAVQLTKKLAKVSTTILVFLYYVYDNSYLLI